MRNIVLALLISCLLGCPAKQAGNEVAFVGSNITGAKLGSDFDLIDHDGKPRHLSDFRGKLVALFFGYTHCPDVCPTTMAELAKSLKLLGPHDSEVQVLFVTLDPERDTSEVLKRYVPSFNPAFLGLRGDKAATEKVARDFKIFFARQESNSKAGYTIDHSAGVYVFDRNGVLRLYLNHGQSAKDIAHDFGLLINE
jgi:protein SCO1/2